ncbi:hypothetical protein CKF54_02765 [Psittacicella hinzii]|uniref:HTH deoR-type domain-containing protein n=1 Tax=Psittacicella hinzii TaxID=2028575 RepID=A0A3A1Y8E3_9GAMM|nr:DeoR/GlpR family DNA-binding transcription regulator [Psittacicella hinzii]RIY33500.1 hypothetical protein CKF54_02765 [Psittacicella hinzii]
MRKKIIRQALVVKAINENSYLTVEELERLLNVSQITIRRDLAELEERKLLVRKLGGAVSLRGIGLEVNATNDEINPLPPLNIDIEDLKKVDQNLGKEEVKQLAKESEEYLNLLNDFEKTGGKNDNAVRSLSQRCKLAIAKQAASLIHNNSRIAIDSGSTTAELVKFLGNKKKVLVMTNSLSIGYELSLLPEQNRPSLIITGGLFDSHSESLYSKSMIPSLKEYNFDICFVGADGFGENGTTTKFERSSYTKVMSEASKFTVVLIESSKISNKQPNDELSWEDIDLVITDSLISRKVRKELMKSVEVIAADINSISF